MKTKRIIVFLLVIMVVLSLVGTSAFARGRYWEKMDLEEGLNPNYDMIKYSEIGPRLREIEKASNRVQVEIIGHSGTAGYPLYQVIISEPSAGGKLGQYQALRNMMISDPERAQNMIEAGMDFKAPVYINGSIHGNEAPGVDTAMWLIEKLAFENTEEVMNILEHCIVVVNVVHNPEGRTAMTRQNFAGFDLNRDWLTQSQVETRIVVEEILRWHPIVLLDLHGFFDAYTGPDPGTGPDNPNYGTINELTYDWNVKLSKASEAGLKDYFGDDFEVWVPYLEWDFADWDGWAPIYTEQYAYFHGSIAHCLETHDRGWEGVEAHNVVVWSVLNFTAENKEAMVYDQIELFRRSKLGYETEKEVDMPWAYLIPHESMQPSAHQLAQGIDFLLFNDVQVHRLTSPVKVDGVTYPRGSYVVQMEQSKRYLANIILQDGHNVTDLFPAEDYGDDWRLWDIAAWSHPRLWGYDAIPIEEEISLKLSTVNNPSYPKGEIEPGSAAAYALTPSENNYALAVNTLLDDGIQVLYSEDGFTSAGREFVPGTVIIDANRSTLTRLVGDLGLSFAVLSELPEDLEPLRPLKIAVCERRNDPGSSFVLGELGFEVTRISEADLRDGNVNLEEYDVFINADARWGSIGTSGQRMVNEFLNQGGGYIGLYERGAVFANDAGILNTTYGVSGTAGNGILEVLFDLEDPLVSTYRERDTVFAYEPVWFTEYSDTADVVASLPGEDFFMSGYWRQPELAAGHAVIIRDRIINGETENGAVLMGIHPTFRAHPQKTFRLLANAVYWTTLQ